MIEHPGKKIIKQMVYKKKYYNEFGIPFNRKLAENLDAQIKRVKHKKASLLILDGHVGEGKTTLLVHILDYINKQYGLPPIDLEHKNHPQLAMGGEEFTTYFRECFYKKLPCIGYDEAGDFNKRGALTRFNAMLNRTFETFRGFQIIVVLALPVFAVLDNNLFDLAIPRGLINVRHRSMYSGKFYAYSLRSMSWLRYWYEKLPKGQKHKMYMKVDSNFFGTWYDLEPERSKKLDILSTKGKLKILKKSEVKIAGLIGYAEIARKLNRSIIWVRQKVAEKKIKHARIIERAKYFNNEVLDQLSEYLK